MCIKHCSPLILMFPGWWVPKLTIEIKKKNNAILKNGNCSVLLNNIMTPNNDLLNLELVCGIGSKFGKTFQKVIEGINGHKIESGHLEKHGHCRIISEHFNVGLYKFKNKFFIN